MNEDGNEFSEEYIEELIERNQKKRDMVAGERRTDIQRQLRESNVTSVNYRGRNHTVPTNSVDTKSRVNQVSQATAVRNFHKKSQQETENNIVKQTQNSFGRLMASKTNKN